MTITFDQEGMARCLYSDEIALREIGQLIITRASTIEFDEERQLWIVRIDGKEVYRHASRENCLRWERATLDR